MSHLVVVGGTGTGVGKTHLTEALALCATARGVPTAAWKPVETGIALGGPSLPPSSGATPPPTTRRSPNGGESPQADFARLRACSSFHVQHLLEPLYAFEPPVSPHLAARIAGRPIELDPIVERARQLQVAVGEPGLVLVEQAGGICSPLSTQLLNLETIPRLAPRALCLVGVDRLGALHDILACWKVLQTLAVCPPIYVLLSTPAEPDASTGTNARELLHFVPATTRLVTLPRADPRELAKSAHLSAFIDFFARAT